MPTQNEMAEVWLRKHGIGDAKSEALASGPLLAQEERAGSEVEPAEEDDWATDAQRWYEQRAQGVDVAQLLRYQQPVSK